MSACVCGLGEHRKENEDFVKVIFSNVNKLYHIGEENFPNDYILNKTKQAFTNGETTTIYEIHQDYYGELLFKENGLSGIIAFDLSRVIRENDVVSFDIAPDFSIDKLTKLLNSGDLDVILTGLFPKMLCFDLIKRSGKNIKELVKVIKNYTFKIVKKGSFDNSQITVGGVQTKEVSQCFESKLVKGLYIVGELLDVDGASGGYNLYFAWLSGIVSSINILKNFK